MCAERQDDLAHEILSIEEGVDRHRHVAPPNRITEKDDIVLAEIGQLANDFRTGVFFLLLLGGFCRGTVFLRIRLDGLDFKEVTVRAFGDHLCKNLCVSLLDVADTACVFVGAREVHDKDTLIASCRC